MKILGWVLFVIGLAGLVYAWYMSAGVATGIVAAIIGIVGLWLGLRDEKTGVMT